MRTVLSDPGIFTRTGKTGHQDHLSPGIIIQFYFWDNIFSGQIGILRMERGKMERSRITAVFLCKFPAELHLLHHM
jgi:hypothetical protein